MRVGQCGSEGFENPQLRQQRPAMIHIRLIFARPMKRFPRQDLQGLQIDAAAFVELQVPLGKILADDADQSHRAEKTGRYGSVAGGAAQKTRVFGFRSFDRVQRGRADNQNAHKRFRLFFTANCDQVFACAEKQRAIDNRRAGHASLPELISRHH